MSKLRIGIVTDRVDELENWKLKLLRDVLGDGRFVVCTVVLVDPVPTQAWPSAFQVIAAWEERLLARQPLFPADKVTAALEKAALVDLRGVPDPTAVIANALAEPDMLIRLTPRHLPGTLLTEITFGEWSFDFVDRQSASGDWTGFAEALEHASVTTVRLTVRTADMPRPAAIAEASYNTKFSAARNAAFVKEKSVILLMRELRRLVENGQLPDHFVLPPPPASPDAGQTVKYARHLSVALARRSLEAAKSLVGGRTGSWAVRMGTGTMESFAPAQTVELPLAKGLWAADPFLFRHDGSDYLFFECYPNNRVNAWISVARIHGDTALVLGDVLRREYHLSYPFVFRHDGKIFMVPETHQANRVEVWRCVEFPHRWEIHATALEGSSPVDTVMFEHQGSWWMLTSLSDHHAFSEHSSELYAFSIDGPALRSVVPHKRNPVVIGSDVARNAGRVIKSNGRLLRPSQCNAHGLYGYGLNIMEILRLDQDEYVETPLRFIGPHFDRGLIGCHHIDALGGRVVIDVCRA